MKGGGERTISYRAGEKYRFDGRNSCMYECTTL